MAMKLLKKFRLPLIVIAISLVGYIFLALKMGYPAITGTIVDDETGEPISGAIALCVWTVTGGLIERTHSVAHVSEGFSDAQGKIKIPGTWDIRVDPPELTIYQKGYVAWNNNKIFISRAEYINNPQIPFTRFDFNWRNGFIVRMKKWKDIYTFIEHESFISKHALSQTMNFVGAYEWEKSYRIKERNSQHEAQH